MNTYAQSTLANKIVSLMRVHGVTIRTVAAQLDVPMTRVRQIRNNGPENMAVALDYLEAIFANSRFSIFSCNALVNAKLNCNTRKI